MMSATFFMSFLHRKGLGRALSMRNFLIPLDSHHDFCTPDKLTGTRYWPKMLCDEDGLNCLLGSSGGPGEGCSA